MSEIILEMLGIVLNNFSGSEFKIIGRKTHSILVKLYLIEGYQIVRISETDHIEYGLLVPYEGNKENHLDIFNLEYKDFLNHSL